MDRGRPANPLEYAPSGQPYQGSAIRQMRQAKQLGVRQFAALIPCNHAALSKVENNRAPVSRKTLQRIAELLGVDAKELRRLPVHPRLFQQQVRSLEQPQIHEQLQKLTAKVAQLEVDVAILKYKIPSAYWALLTTGGRNYTEDKDELELVFGSKQN